MGLPLLNGFVGEFTILQGTFMENKVWAAWAVPGVILAAAYLLWLYQRVFFGKVENPKNEKLMDLSARELATFIPLVAIAFWIGLYPKPFFQILATPVNNLVSTVRPDYPGLQKPVLATQPATSAPAETPAVQPQPTKTDEPAKPAAVTQSRVGAPLRVASGTPATITRRAFSPPTRQEISPARAGTANPSTPVAAATSARDDNFDRGTANASLKARSTRSARDDNQPIVAAQVNAMAAATGK